jgi:hypothetical protein
MLQARIWINMHDLMIEPILVKINMHNYCGHSGHSDQPCELSKRSSKLSHSQPFMMRRDKHSLETSDIVSSILLPQLKQDLPSFNCSITSIQILLQHKELFATTCPTMHKYIHSPPTAILHFIAAPPSSRPLKSLVLKVCI